MADYNLDHQNLDDMLRNGAVREEVMSEIWDISRIPLPFTDMIGSATHANKFQEWVLDKLRDPLTDNAHVDGIDVDQNDTNLGTRVGNYTQTSLKEVRISHLAQAANSIGRMGGLSYQLAQRQRELRRDVEAQMLTSQGSVAGDGSTIAGISAGLGAWLTTNVDFGAGGSAGGYDTTTGLVDAPVHGTARPLSETLIRDIAESVYIEGGETTYLMGTPAVIRALSEYLFTSSARVGTIMSDQGKSREQAAALGSVSVFVTDFGTLRLVPNRLQQKQEAAAPDDSAFAFILDPEYLSLCYLHGYRTDMLAKTGLAENRQMSVDWSLIVNTEKAHGLIGDIDPSADVTA